MQNAKEGRLPRNCITKSEAHGRTGSRMSNNLKMEGNFANGANRKTGGRPTRGRGEGLKRECPPEGGHYPILPGMTSNAEG